MHEADPETDNLIDDIEIEKRTLRKKKKFGKDVSSTGHRVIISDDQVTFYFFNGLFGIFCLVHTFFWESASDENTVVTI